MSLKLLPWVCIQLQIVQKDIFKMRPGLTALKNPAISSSYSLMTSALIVRASIFFSAVKAPIDEKIENNKIQS